MNEIRRDRHQEELARIREIVSRHRLPEFVTGFDVQFGEFDGDPAVWLVFRRAGGDELGLRELERRAQLMNALYSSIGADLMAQDYGRIAYFRSEKAEAAS